jgi:hypothetical protein
MLSAHVIIQVLEIQHPIKHHHLYFFEFIIISNFEPVHQFFFQLKMNYLWWIALAPLIFILLFLVLVAAVWCVRRKPLFPPVWVQELPIEQGTRVKQLSKLGHDVFSVLNTSGVPYVVICGSLLGIVRHDGQIIPWDDDIDIGIDSAHKNTVLKLMSTIDGVSIETGAGSSHLVCKNGVFVDIIFMKTENDKLVYDDAMSRFKWPNEWLDPDVFTDRGRLKANFCDSVVYIPKNNVQYLDRAYPGWSNKACLGWIHESGFKPLVYSLFSTSVAPICKKMKCK